MENKKFLIITILSAIVLNVAIIGCNRQGSGSAQAEGADESSNGETTQTDTTALQENQPALFNHPVPDQTTAAPEKNPYKDANIEIKTFVVDPPGTGYGYDIVINGHATIHQYNIPGIPGINGFSLEKHALKVAELAVYKIRHNIMPPTLDARELDSLGVLK